MQNIFRMDGWFYRTGMKVWQLLVLNTLILITSIPIVTIGAAQTAGFATTKRMIELDEGKIVATYIKAFKQNLKKSTWLTFLFAGGFYFLWIDWQFIFKVNRQQVFIFIGVLIVTLIVINFWQYAFFYQSNFEDSIKQTFINTLKLLIQRPLMSLLLILLLIGPYLVFALSSYLIVFGIYIHLFFGFSFHLYLRTFILLYVFKKPIKKELLS